VRGAGQRLERTTSPIESRSDGADGRGCALVNQCSGAQRLSQEIKAILIVVSATLAALLVHHVAEQAQASAGMVASSKPPDPADAIPFFQ
jgi:hypothetical protein